MSPRDYLESSLKDQRKLRCASAVVSSSVSPSTKVQHQEQCGFLAVIAVCEGGGVLQLLSPKDQSVACQRE